MIDHLIKTINIRRENLLPVIWCPKIRNDTDARFSQAADMRRARRQQVVEMLHMAKRPFAYVAVVLSGTAASQQPETGGNHAHHQSGGGGSGVPRSADIRPLAIEPTSDANAAVTTVLIKLPERGQQSAGTRLALGSTLVLNMLNPRGGYASNAHRHHRDHHHHHHHHHHSAGGGARQRRNVSQ